eukprot:5696232-Amphidinium_carterae.3
MDYFKTMLNAQNILQTTIHNKKHKLPRLTEPRHYLHRDWCKHCVQGKNRSQHHQRGGLTKQSITQIDYAFIKSDNDKHNATILTICESTKGLGYATVVDYKGLHPRAIKAIMRFIIN